MVVRHVVLFNIKQSATAEQIQTCFSTFRSLVRLPSVLDVSIGPSFTHERSGGFTHGLVVSFENRECFREYTADKNHIEVLIKHLRHTMGRLIAVDIEDHSSAATAAASGSSYLADSFRGQMAMACSLAFVVGFGVGKYFTRR